MKKYYKQSIAAVFLLVALALFTACSSSNDDETTDYESAIVGTWQLCQQESYGETLTADSEGKIDGALAYIQFKASGNYHEVWVQYITEEGLDTTESVTTLSGTWALTNNIVVIYYTYGNTTASSILGTIVSVDDTNLVLTTDSYTTNTYVKVLNSTIIKYTK